jgi:hypothetical protein
MTVETVQATDFLIVVDNLDGLRAYRVEHFEIDMHRAVLRPVFNGGKRLRDFSSMATFRLVNRLSEPSWQYDAALRLAESREQEEEMAFGAGGKTPKVQVATGRSLPGNKVTFSTSPRTRPSK